MRTQQKIKVSLDDTCTITLSTGRVVELTSSEYQEIEERMISIRDKSVNASEVVGLRFDKLGTAYAVIQTFSKADPPVRLKLPFVKHESL
jgi:hypothetical protein